MKFFQLKKSGTLKKRLAASVIILLFGCVLPSPLINIAHAQSTGSASSACASSATADAAALKANPVTGALLNSGDLNCIKSLFSGQANLTQWDPTAFAGVANFLFSIAGYLLGIVGMIFNWVMVLTVFQFGAYFGNSQGMLIAWGVLRDIGNIILLFGFIFMGVLMILDLNSVGAKKAIPQLIIFAILLNFSLFAAEAVVDVSNVLSAAIFNQAGQCTSLSCITPTTAASAVGSASNLGISGVIISDLGLNTLFKPNSNTIMALGNGTHDALFMIGAAIFMTITMIVLLAAAIMFFIRAVVLAFVLVTSPLGFAGMAIPPLKRVADWWWKTLIQEAFFAPVFLLLVLVSLKIMSGIGTTAAAGSSTSFADTIASPSSSNVGIILIFALLISFLIASLVTAKGMGAMGADFATNIARKTVTGTLMAPVRVAGFGGGIAYQRTVGAWGAKQGHAYSSFIGKQIAKGGVMGALAKNFDYAAGSSIEGGFHKVSGAKFGGVRSFDEEKKHKEARDKETSHAAHGAHLTSDIKAGLKAPAGAAGNAARDAMDRALQTMPLADKVKFVNGASKEDREKMSTVLSTKVFKDILANADASTEAKEHLVEGRYAEAEQAAAHGTAEELKEAIKSYDTKEFEVMAVNAPTLHNKIMSTVNSADGGSVVKESIIDELIKSQEPTRTQKDILGLAKRSGRIKQMYADADAGRTRLDVPEVQKLMKNMGRDYAELSNKILLRPEAAVGANREKMAAIMAKSDTLKGAERKAFVRNIDAYYQSIAPTNPDYADYKAEHADIKKYLDKPASRNWWDATLTDMP